MSSKKCLVCGVLVRNDNALGPFEWAYCDDCKKQGDKKKGMSEEEARYAAYEDEKKQN